jgi:SAM-dependent methyltransferase
VPVHFLYKHLGKVSNDKKTWLSKIVVTLLGLKADSICNRIQPYINGKNILDIGVGVGGVYSVLKTRGYNVVGIDVKDVSLIKEAKPLVYDGSHIPFENNFFDAALIIQVLHHCKDGLCVLDEALRVSRRVIFIEDTYRNFFEKLVVSVSDMIGNFEFYWHAYHTVSWWKKYLEDRGLKVVHSEEYSEFTYWYSYGRYTMFVVEKA